MRGLANKQDGFAWGAQEARFSGGALADFYDVSMTCRAVVGALEKDAAAESGTWKLLADVCSLIIVGSKTNAPFAPLAVVDTRRSFAIEDLSADDLNLLSSIVDQITRVDLAARVHDVLWARRHGSGIAHAVAALDLYAQIPIESSEYEPGLVDVWERAAMLARSLGKATSEKAKQIEAYLSERLMKLALEGGALAIMLSRMMVKHRIGSSRAEEFANTLANCGEVEPTTGLVGGLQFLECAREWYQIAGISTRADDITIKLAEAAVAEGGERAGGDNPSFMVAAYHLESAIQLYRGTSHKYREERGLEARLAEIRGLHREYSLRATEEFELIESGSIDLSDIARAAEASVQGKDTMSALMGLISVAPIPSVQQLADLQKERVARGSIADIFGRSIITNGGRVAYKVPALATSSEEHVVASHVVTSHQMFIGSLVQGAIAPALRSISEEHWIRKELLDELARRSPAVPPGREAIFALGLAAGFDWDFVTSSHLLIPQIENLIRFHLKSREVVTTSIDPDGTEAEKTFGPLLDLAREHGVFDEDIEFAFRATLVDPRGSNLRNDLLHGLCDPGTANGAAGVYIWWLTLYLVLVPFWTRSRRPSDDAGATGSEAAAKAS